MAGQRTRRRIPEATVARLPVYLRILSERFESGVSNMSSEELADAAGLNAAKVRKDLSYLGSYGTRGVGYDVEFLVYQIRRELGLTHDWHVVIVGAGHLGQALAGYGGFGERGFPVAESSTSTTRRSAASSVACEYVTPTNSPRWSSHETSQSGSSPRRARPRRTLPTRSSPPE